MNGTLRNRMALGAVAVIVSVSLAGCGATPPTENKAAADELSAAWAKAFNAGDATAVAALYAEDAHSMPPTGW